MATFVCPSCKKQSEIFPVTTGGAKKMCEDLDVTFLGSLPLDPLLARCCDEGKDYYKELPDSLAIKSLNLMINKIIEVCDHK